MIPIIKSEEQMKPLLKIKPDIIIVDDHQIFRQGLKAIINYENIGSVIGEASSGEEFINLLCKLRPDLVLMDIEMPKMNGFEALCQSLEMLPDLKIIAFSVYSNAQYYDEMRKLGAKGFVQKSSGINELEYAIKIVMKGESYFINNASKQYLDDITQNEKINIIQKENNSSIPKGKMRFFPWFESQKNKSIYYE